MSTANIVPETYELEGDDAMDTLRSTGSWRLVRDSYTRLRMADGFSHGRATAFQVVLALLPGAVVLVALASLLDWQPLSKAIFDSIQSFAPGPAGEVFRDAFDQGREAGSTSDWAAIVAGSIALLVAGTTVFGQIERTCNRVYGIERDRPTVAKYSHAFGMMLTAGTLTAMFFIALGVGGSWELGDGFWHDVWQIARWPIGALLLTAAYTIVLQRSPRRRQPDFSWLFVGALVGVALAMVVSLLLHFYLGRSGSFGDTYGPIAGFLGVMLWAYGSVLGLYLGVAFAAQLEAVRASRPDPVSQAKLELGEPDAAVLSYAGALTFSARQHDEDVEEGIDQGIEQGIEDEQEPVNDLDHRKVGQP